MITILRRIAAAARGALSGLRAGFRSVTEVPANIKEFKADWHKEAESKVLANAEERRILLQALIDRMKSDRAASAAPLIEPEKLWTVAKPAPGVVPDDKRMAFDASLESSFSGMAGWAQSSSLFAEGLAFLGYPYLAQLSQRPEYRVISETWADEMTRKWIRLTATSSGRDTTAQKSDKLVKIEAEFKRLHVQDVFRQAAELDGFFGRSHIYIELSGVKDDDREELMTSIGEGNDATSKAKIGLGSIKGLRVIEPVWTYPNGYNSSEPLKSDFFKPRTWYVMGTEVHSTRLLTFIGRPMPDLLKPAYSFGGLSLSQMAKPYVDNWLRTRQSVSDAVSNFSIMVLLTDMATLLNEGAAADLVTRAEFFNTTRDNKGLMLADKNSEDLKNVSMPLGGLDHLQAQAQEQLCSVSQIPLVKFTGISPTGLNASSEGEIKVFQDKAGANQAKLFGDNLSKLLMLVQLSLFGEVDPEIGYVWEPLDTLDPSAEANRRKTEADTDAVLIDHGIISPEESRARIAADKMSPFASLDIDAVPEPPVGGGDDEAAMAAQLAGDESINAAGVLFKTLELKPRVLLLRRAADDLHHPGTWDLPGGCSEAGELPVATAAREAAEESGLRPRMQALRVISSTDEDGIAYTTFEYDVSEPTNVVLSAEHDEFMWAPLDALPSPIIPPLAALLAKLKGEHDA